MESSAHTILHKSTYLAFAGAAVLFCGPLVAQTSCTGSPLAAIVHDSTGALIPSATVTLDAGAAVTGSSNGHFRFGCVPQGQHQLRVAAKGFSDATVTTTLPHAGELDIALNVASVETTVAVSGDDQQASNAATTSGASRTLSGKDLISLADDPDDLKRELQQLAATAGSNPASTIITVDGFQNATQIPPKSSIEYIKVNPDLYSAEYRQPPFEGGRVEVYTKPGQSTYHGALFTTNGSSWMNARNPFSTSKGALGKQRYGFELSGPVRKQGSDFALTLEHRSIDDTAVVNAITLDSAGNQVSMVASVPAPQSLWLATARVGWQLGQKNTFTAAYSANTNSLENLGVGGTALAESGYDSDTYEHVLRLSDITLASVKLMHEARVSLDWTGETDSPLSTAPLVQVAGAFTGGGATIGAQRLRSLVLEVDDDAVISTKKHLLKVGVQFRNSAVHDRLTTNFNGSYTFGGGTAPVLDASGNPVAGQTETITGIEQYRRAQLGLAGGTPTDYSNVAGNPAVGFMQTRAALFVQDSWKLRPNVQVAMGFRYYLQDNPNVYSGATPRLGVAWTPDKKAKWQLHGHLGLFTGNFGTPDYQELLRMDGVNRITSTIYNPVYGNPLGNDAEVVHSLRTLAPHFSNISFSIENLGGSHEFPHGWNVSADYYTARIWNDVRTQNVNSPLNDSPTGPRPGVANLNVLQLNNSGQGGGNVVFVGVNQHAYKRVQFFFGGVRVNIKDDTDDTEFFTPQSSRTDAGEFAYRTGNSVWQIFGNGSLTTPGKVQLSTDLHAGSGAPYDITTGFDNNGDGDFNDRPQYAPAGAPDAVPTKYGLLTASGGIGVLPRNTGRLPWTIYMDANAERVFSLTHNTKADHPQTLTVNVRSSNLLNHTNVTAESGVLGSPLFGVPYGADNSRRVEGGLRYSF